MRSVERGNLAWKFSIVVPMPKSKTNGIRVSHRLSDLVSIEEHTFKTKNLRQELDRFGENGGLECLAIKKRHNELADILFADTIVKNLNIIFK